MIFVGIVLTVAFSSSGAAGEERQNRTITIDRILEAHYPTLIRARWGSSSGEIFTEYAAKAGLGAYVERVSIGTTGALDRLHGSNVSVSSDGFRYVLLEDNRWVIRDVRSPRIGARDVAKYDRQITASQSLIPLWSDDDRFIVFFSPETPDPFNLKETIDEVQGVKVLDIATNLLYQEKTRTRIVVVEADHPDTVYRAIELPGVTVTGACWGVGPQILVASTSFDDFDNPHSTVSRIDIDTGTQEDIFVTPGRMPGMVPRLSPTGDSVALALDLDNGSWSDFVSLVILDLHTKKIRRLTDSVYVAGDYEWAKDGRSILFRGRHGGFDQIYQVYLADRRLRRRSDSDRRHYDVQLSRDGRYLSYQTEDGYGRHDLRIRSLADDQERIVKIVADPKNTYKFGRFKQDQWENHAGEVLNGFVVFPPDFDGRKKYPMLVDIHGGGSGSRLYLMAPLTISLAPGPLEWHAWAALGYVVFVPDYGSTGSYGESAIARRRRDADLDGIVNDSRDIEAGVSHMLQTEFIDCHQVVLLGHSAGGTRGEVLLTRTKLFGAAVLHEAVAGGALENLIQWTTGPRTGTPFEGLFLKQLHGSLADVPSRYTSGFLYQGYRITTPTLILVGSPDHGAVPPLVSEALFSVLRQAGVPSRMLRFVTQGHTYTDPAAARLAFSEAERWFGQYLRATKLAKTQLSCPRLPPNTDAAGGFHARRLSGDVPSAVK